MSRAPWAPMQCQMSTCPLGGSVLDQVGVRLGHLLGVVRTGQSAQVLSECAMSSLHGYLGTPAWALIQPN